MTFRTRFARPALETLESIIAPATLAGPPPGVCPYAWAEQVANAAAEEADFTEEAAAVEAAPLVEEAAPPDDTVFVEAPEAGFAPAEVEAEIEAEIEAAPAEQGQVEAEAFPEPGVEADARVQEEAGPAIPDAVEEPAPEARVEADVQVDDLVNGVGNAIPRGQDEMLGRG